MPKELRCNGGANVDQAANARSARKGTNHCKGAPSLPAMLAWFLISFMTFYTRQQVRLMLRPKRIWRRDSKAILAAYEFTLIQKHSYLRMRSTLEHTRLEITLCSDLDDIVQDLVTVKTCLLTN
jgi:hypothetical protein